MGLFQGKSSTERNKLIAAGVLGLVALFALYLAFGRGLFSSSSTSASVKNSPTPKPGVSPGNADVSKAKFSLPTADEQAFIDQTTSVPVVYRVKDVIAPDAGRNIFSFYEPPPPCPGCTPYPTPKPTATPTPATPTPTPIFAAFSVNPQMVYAGSRGFKLEVNGARFTPDAHIYFNQAALPTTFVNEQKLVADIPTNLIAREGSMQVIVQTPDGRAYSDQLMLTVQPAPRPSFQYIGMIGRARYNNDTAYFTETGRPAPFGARLNDVINGRFRLVDISATETVFEDVNLGFRHRVIISKASTGTTTGPGTRTDPGFMPFNPGGNPQTDIPGIPNNIQRYVPPAPQPAQPKKSPTKGDVDDDGDGN